MLNVERFACVKGTVSLGFRVKWVDVGNFGCDEVIIIGDVKE